MSGEVEWLKLNVNFIQLNQKRKKLGQYNSGFYGTGHPGKSVSSNILMCAVAN